LLQFDCLQFDCDAFGHDLAILEEIRRDALVATLWHKSEAHKLLRRDIEGGKHHQFWPIQMYQSEAVVNLVWRFSAITYTKKEIGLKKKSIASRRNKSGLNIPLE